MLPTVAIDTNSINVHQKNPDLNQLEKWHKAGLIDIRRTSTLAEELAGNLGPDGELRRQKAQEYSEGRKSRSFTMRRSTMRGGDILRGPPVDEWRDPITAILFPGKDFNDLVLKEQRDVVHLATHKLHAWDYFVTDDRRHILSHAKELWRQLGIRVLSPEDAVREIGGSLADSKG